MLDVKLPTFHHQSEVLCCLEDKFDHVTSVWINFCLLVSFSYFTFLLVGFSLLHRSDQSSWIWRSSRFVYIHQWVELEMEHVKSKSREPLELPQCLFCSMQCSMARDRLQYNRGWFFLWYHCVIVTWLQHGGTSTNFNWQLFPISHFALSVQLSVWISAFADTAFDRFARTWFSK